MIADLTAQERHDVVHSELLRRIDVMADAQDIDALKNMLHSLTTNPKFHTALHDIDAAKQQLKKMKRKYKSTSERVTTLANRATEEDHEDLRTVTRELLEYFEKLSGMKAASDEYRVLAAHTAEQLANLQTKKAQADGSFLEFTGETIGDLVSQGSFEDGSPAWLQQRTTGIGGSDVGPILKVGEKEYRYQNYRDIIESKLNPTFEAPVGNPLKTATGRGHAWEEYLRQVFAELHPELGVWYAKNSFEHEFRSWVKANFDGLLSVEKPGVIDGLVEIKTSANPEDWGDVSLGYKGIPKGYLYQMLWYMVHAKLHYGYLIVAINDHDIRVYSFTMDDPGIENLAGYMLRKTEDFWFSEIVHRAPVTARPKRAFNHATPNSQSRCRSSLAAIADTNPDDIAYRNDLSMIRSAEDMVQNIRKVMTERERPFIVVDIETTSASPAYGRVVELSVVRLDSPDAEPVTVFDELFGLPSRVLAGAGVGMSNIHRITPDMLEGKPLFEEPATQQRLMELFRSGIVVAHNKMFEERFFTAFLDGFGTALRNGEITMLDTMDLSKSVMVDTPNDKLETFAEYNGVPYVDAHAALPDTTMTAVALGRFLQSITDTGRWEALRPTQHQREAAERSAASYVRG